MQKYSLSNFRGMFPRYQAYLINDSAAQTLVDGNTLSGGLDAFRQDSLVRTTDSLYKDIYRYVYNGSYKWLFFPEYVDIVRSAVIDDVSNQSFIVDATGLRVFDKDTLMRSTSNTIDNTNSYKAGISIPDKATLATTNVPPISTQVYKVEATANAAFTAAATSFVLKKPTVGAWPSGVTTTNPMTIRVVHPTSSAVEVMKVTGINTSSSTVDTFTVIRAQDGTTALAFPVATKVDSTIAESTTTFCVNKPTGNVWPDNVSAINYVDMRLTDRITTVTELVRVVGVNTSNAAYDIVAVTRAQNNTTANVFSPESAMIQEGALSTIETRAYALSYGRQWISGKVDLGPASDSAETVDKIAYIDVHRGENVIVSNIKQPTDLGENTNRVYIYRSTVGSSGAASWREVIHFSTEFGAQLPPSVTFNSDDETYTFVDTVNTVDLGDTPQNFEWTCPEGLQGIISLRNGVFAAYKNNTVYLSVPYQGHAWPEKYAIPLDFNILGLGCFGNTLVICTTNKTILCNASNPESTILVPLQESNTCVSKRSIVSLQESVLYATRQGLVQVTNNGVTQITNSILTEHAWRQFNPSTIQACNYNGKYLMFFETDKVAYSGCVIDLTDVSVGLLGLSQKVSCLRMDDSSTDIFVQYMHPILLRPAIFTFASNVSLKRVYRWTSKKFLNKYGLTTLSAGKVNFYKDTTIIDNPEFSYIAASGAFNAPYVNLFALNGDATTNQHVQITHASDWCMLTFYMNDTQKAVIHVRDNIPFRLPSGFRGDSFYVDIVSTQPIARVQLASGIGELE